MLEILPRPVGEAKHRLSATKAHADSTLGDLRQDRGPFDIIHVATVYTFFQLRAAGNHRSSRAPTIWEDAMRNPG
jgi:hypothetical protein